MRSPAANPPETSVDNSLWPQHVRTVAAVEGGIHGAGMVATTLAFDAARQIMEHVRTTRTFHVGGGPAITTFIEGWLARDKEVIERTETEPIFLGNETVEQVSDDPLATYARLIEMRRGKLAVASVFKRKLTLDERSVTAEAGEGIWVSHLVGDNLDPYQDLLVVRKKDINMHLPADALELSLEKLDHAHTTLAKVADAAGFYLQLPS